MNLISINETETKNFIKTFIENHKLEVEIKMCFQKRKFEITRYTDNYDDSNLLNEFFIQETFKIKKNKIYIIQYLNLLINFLQLFISNKNKDMIYLK